MKKHVFHIKKSFCKFRKNLLALYFLVHGQIYDFCAPVQPLSLSQDSGSILKEKSYKLYKCTISVWNIQVSLLLQCQTNEEKN